MELKKKVVILAIVAVIGGIVLNFEELAFGSSATTKNLIVTFIYIVIWIYFLIIGIKNKSHKMIKFCFVFWIITLFFSLLTVYINTAEASVDWAIPFVIVLLGPLYGIRYYVNDFQTLSIIIALISFGISMAAILSFKRIK